MKETQYYAEYTAVYLAKHTVCQFIEAWARQRNPTKAIMTAFFDKAVKLDYDADGHKRIDGIRATEYFRHIEEKHAKEILKSRLYLVNGLCSWAELWQAYCKRYKQ